MCLTLRDCKSLHAKPELLQGCECSEGSKTRGACVQKCSELFCSLVVGGSVTSGLFSWGANPGLLTVARLFLNCEVKLHIFGVVFFFVCFFLIFFATQPANI